MISSHNMVATARQGLVLTRRLQPTLAAFNLSVTQWLILMSIRDGGVRSNVELARETATAASNITYALRRLRADRLLKREGSYDRRFLLLSLTAEGQRLLAEVEPELEKALQLNHSRKENN